MILLNWLISALSVMLVAYVVPGITVENFLTALLVAIVLGLVNSLVRPILVILTLPITILSLGLFLLVINALLLMLVSAVIPGFEVAGFVPAVVGSIVLALIGWASGVVFGDKKKTAL